MFPITDGYIATGQKVVLYGPEGIGKTLLASRFPNPVFIDTEGSTRSYHVARFPTPSSWEMLKQEAEYALTRPNGLKTLVIDTADWAEKMCNRSICQSHGKNGIEDFGYGKGYTYAAEEFGRLLDILDRVAASGIHVVFTAHAILRKVELPDDMGAYDKWELKCSKQLSPILKEWADMVLFLNYKTFIVQNEAGKGKAQGGQRMMYTNHRPHYDAKNRFCLPDELPLDYKELSHIFDHDYSKVAGYHAPPEYVSSEPAQAGPPAPEVSPARPAEPGIHPALADLMTASHVQPDELQRVVGEKGYFPSDMPVEQYPQDFVEGWCIPFWPQITEMISTHRTGFTEISGDDPEIPF